MATIDTMRTALAEVEADLAGLEQRRAALELAADGLRGAIGAHEGVPGADPKPAQARRRTTPSKPAVKRPKITPDDLVAGVRELGGSATVEQLVEKLGLPDGRSLNGARRQAVDEQRIVYADRTYSLPSADPRWPDETDGGDAEA